MMRKNYRVLFIGLLVISIIASRVTGQVTKTIRPGNLKTSVLKKDHRIFYDTVHISNPWRHLDTAWYNYSIDLFNICTDSKGIIYFISRNKFYKVVEDKIIDITPADMAVCAMLNINEKDELLLRGWDKWYSKLCYLLKNGAWEPVAEYFANKFSEANKFDYENSSRKISNKPADPTFLNYVGLLYWPRNRFIFCGTSGGKGFIYEFVNNEWKKLNEFNWGQLDSTNKYSRDNLILAGNNLYSLYNFGLYKQDTSVTVSIVQRKQYNNKKVPIIVAKEDMRDAEQAYTENKIGIFEQGGKMGLRTSEGKIVAYPVFKSITFEKNPESEVGHIYIYHLKGDDMDVYFLKNNEDPSLLHGPIESIKFCSTCDGDGIIKDKNGKTIPCTACEGGKKAVTIYRHKYEYDKSKSKYIHGLDVSYFDRE